MIDLSPGFVNRVIGVHGQKGRNWLQDLPGIQDRLARRWSLSHIQPAAELSYNYLAYALNEQRDPVVLKIGVPNPELDSEILALKLYSGRAAARLIDADPGMGALLLERILPGEDLRSVEDDAEATRIAARLMADLWLPDPGSPVFPTAGDWCRGFERYQATFHTEGPLPAELLQQASDLSRNLLGSCPQTTLLHGDLHHMNILADDQRGWAAIDPKGVIGEPAFELGALLLNPFPDLVTWPDLDQIQDQRIRILAETLALDENRIRDWGFVRSVLSAVWSVEDGEPWTYPIEIAKTILNE